MGREGNIKKVFGRFLHDLCILPSDFPACQTVTRTSKAHQGLKSRQEDNPENTGLLSSVGAAGLEDAGGEEKTTVVRNPEQEILVLLNCSRFARPAPR